VFLPLQEFVCVLNFGCVVVCGQFLWVGGGFLVFGGLYVNGMGDLEELERGMRVMLACGSPYRLRFINWKADYDMVVFLAVAYSVMEFGQIFEYVSGLGGLEEWGMGVRGVGLWLS
jgi:hypothetical protein